MDRLKRKVKDNYDMISKEIDDAYFGVDVHERESQVAVLENGGFVVMEKRIPTRELKRFISGFPANEKHVAIESVGFIHPIYEDLTDISSCTVTVADPRGVKLIAMSKKKNDRDDALVLGDLLRTGYLPSAYMADEGTMEKRYLVRDRVSYGARSSQLKVSIRWMLKRKGMEVKKPFSREGRLMLKELRLREIDIRLRDLELTESIIMELDERIKEMAGGDKGARLLDTMPGIAPYTALFLSSELGDVDRFPDSKHAAAYIGLVPSLHQSGDRGYTGHITGSGNRWLRRNMIECARAAVRNDQHLEEFYLKLKRKRGEKKALIAVARKMVTYAYWMLKRNLTYEELSPWV